MFHRVTCALKGGEGKGEGVQGMGGGQYELGWAGGLPS